MLFCFSAQKDDEYLSFLGSDNDDELSDSEEAHDNFINASLLLQQQTAAELRTTLAAAVAATAASSPNNATSGDIGNSPVKLPTPRTFRKSQITAGATSSASSACPTSKFVDPSDNHHHHTNSSQSSTASSIISKLGPGAFIRRNLSQLRSKGTEHLQREALRKSNEAALSASIVDDSSSQRYIKLPSSATNKLQSLPQSCTSVSLTGSLSPVAPNSPSPVASASKQSCPLSVAQSPSSLSPNPSSRKLTSSRSSPLLPHSPHPPSHHKLPIAPSLPSQSSTPPTLAPRSANNPPPRPKTSKPNRLSTTTTMSSITATASPIANSRHITSANLVDDNNSANSHHSHHPQVESSSACPGEVSSSPQLHHRHHNHHHHHPRLASSNISSNGVASSATTTTTSTTTSTMAAASTATSSSSSTVAAASSSSSSSSPFSTSSSSSGVSSSATTTSTTTGTHHHHQHQQFINKPPRGWLHPDHKLSDSSIGVTYAVRYIGCLGVNTSMKSLDFDTRSMIAKECINRVCESAGLKTVDKKRRTDKRIARMLADIPSMDHAGVDVNLSITSAHLNLIVNDSGENLAKHDMPNISFASGGDTDTLDFAAYVAKDHRFGRACFVLECGGGRAQDVITTIGQAFELRFKEFLKRTPRSASTTAAATASSSSSSSSTTDNHHHSTNQHHSHPIRTMQSDPDRDYYNDLPGKIPPDISVNGSATTNGKDSNGKVIPPHAAPRKKGINPNLVVSSGELSQVNLIDLNDETTATSMGLSAPLANSTMNSSSKLLVSATDPQYVNCMVGAAGVDSTPAAGATAASSTVATTKDPFDMQPFNNALAAVQASSSSSNDKQLQNGNHHHSNGPKSVGDSGFASVSASSSLSSSSVPVIEFVVNMDLHKEDWFHGPISRNQSESLVIKDGDFLVRESQAQAGQFVLTGMQGGSRKHLLLVDPEGVVRTKDKTFESVSHLINYHRNNGLPIISSESALILKTPIVCLKKPQPQQ